MTREAEYSTALQQLDFGPLRVEVGERPVALSADATVTIWWRDQSELFVAEFKDSQSLRDVRNAVWQVQRYAEESGLRALLVMPYLNRDALDLLREEGVSGLDLSGNGIVEIPGRWWFHQSGRPNRYVKRRSRTPYRGKSALVGRSLLVRPTYETVGEVRDEVERRGAPISMSQVSKVLSALEDDLVVRKSAEGVRLLQPKKLLDALVEGYRPPKPLQTLEAKVELGPELYDRLRARAARIGARISGFDPQRYVVAPQSHERLEVYVNPAIGLDLAEAFGLVPSTRFSNLIVRVTDEPGVFFDLEEAEGFPWCPPLEVYLELMQGGKREKEIALGLRGSLLTPAEAR